MVKAVTAAPCDRRVRTSGLECRFKPDKGFKGVDYSAKGSSGPVQFERDAQEQDPFGLDQFLTDVRHGKKKGEPLTRLHVLPC